VAGFASSLANCSILSTDLVEHDGEDAHHLFYNLFPRALRSLSIEALLSCSSCADANAEMSKARATASNKIATLNGAAIT